MSPLRRATAILASSLLIIWPAPEELYAYADQHVPIDCRYHKITNGRHEIKICDHQVADPNTDASTTELQTVDRSWQITTRNIHARQIEKVGSSQVFSFSTPLTENPPTLIKIQSQTKEFLAITFQRSETCTIALVLNLKSGRIAHKTSCPTAGSDQTAQCRTKSLAVGQRCKTEIVCRRKSADLDSAQQTYDITTDVRSSQGTLSSEFIDLCGPGNQKRTR